MSRMMASGTWLHYCGIPDARRDSKLERELKHGEDPVIELDSVDALDPSRRKYVIPHLDDEKSEGFENEAVQQIALADRLPCVGLPRLPAEARAVARHHRLRL